MKTLFNMLAAASFLFYATRLSAACITADFTFTSTCAMSPTVFTDQSITTPGTLINFRQWQFGDGDTSSQQNPSHVYTSPGSYSVTLLVGNDSLCADLITIDILIDFPFEITAMAEDTISLGDTVGIGIGFNSISGLSPLNTIFSPPVIWQETTGLYAGLLAYDIPDSTTTYTISSINTQGCSSATMLTIVVDHTLKAFTRDDTTVCKGATVSLGDHKTARGGVPPYQYSWSPQAGLSCSDCANPSAFPIDTTTYTVIIEDSQGATASASVTIGAIDCGECQPGSVTPFRGFYPFFFGFMDCVEKGQFYNNATSILTDRTNSSVDTGGVIYRINSMSIDSITGLPCGLSWSSGKFINPADNSETNCISITGLSSDSVGKYSPSIHVTYDLGNDSLGLTLNHSLEFAPGGFVIRLINPGTPCTPVDTTGPFNPGCTNSQYFPPGDYNIEGFVLQSNLNPLASSKVFLVKLSTIDSTVSLLDSAVTNIHGYYNFLASDSTVYVKAIPEISAYPNELPTYYVSAITFQDATAIATGSGVVTANIATMTGVNPGGTGFIGGFISQGAGKRSGIGDPVSGLSLILMNGSSGPVAQTLTDANGYFSFANIAYGVYSVWVDRPGISNDLSPQITVNSSSEHNDNLQFILNSNSLELISTGISKSSIPSQHIFIYPNPSNGNFYVQFLNYSNANIELKLSDIFGHNLMVKNFSSDRNDAYSIHLDFQIGKGIYLLSCKSNETHVISKIVIR